MNRRDTVLAGLAMAMTPLPAFSASHSQGVDAHFPVIGDLAASGSFVVESIEFPELTDVARGRKVPIKVHLPVADGPFPMVIVSHGGGGNWDSNFAQAHHLASHGYVALAVEHVGSNTAVMMRSLHFMANLGAMTRDANEVLGRPKDISFAIDQAEQWNSANGKLRGRMDTGHVGVLGHSFGAYTSMVVGGMRPALDWLAPVVPPGRGLGPNLRDNRIRCGVALSPQGPGEPFFIESSYASLMIPLLGISGSKDEQQGARPENRRRAFALWPPGDKYWIWLANADHTAFSDSTGSNRRMLKSGARDDVQPVVRAATLLFFNAYLKKDASSKKLLNADVLRSLVRGHVSDIELSGK